MSAEPAPQAFPEDEPPLGYASVRERDAIGRALRLAAMREHRLLSLSELIENLSASPDLFAMADLVLFNLMGQFGASKSALWVRSESAGAPVLIRAHGLSRQTAKALGIAC